MKTVFPIEALDRWLQHRMLDVHVAAPCQVLKYDAAAQTVDVRPQVARYVLDSDGGRTAEQVPDLYGVPVAFPRAGGFHFTLPIAVGDYVLVVFSDEPTQAWRSKARQVAPGLLDRHGLNGPFALPCGFPDKAKLATAPPTDAVEIASDDGATAIVVDGSEVRLGDASASDSAVLDSALQAELARLKAELDAVKADLTTLQLAHDTHMHPTAAVGAPSPPTVLAVGVPTVAPANPGPTAAAKVRLI